MGKDLPYCNSCKEKHSGDNCPPHEVRTTGVAWFRQRITDLEGELELANTKIKETEKYAVAGKGLIEVIQGMCEPEVREGDPVDGYIQVYLRQKAEVERLRRELADFKAGAQAEADAGDEARAEIKLLQGEADRMQEIALDSETDVEQLKEELEAERLWIKEGKKLLDVQKDALGNLLAIIHRDGGHHTGEVGERQSVKDAHRIWADRGVEIEREKQARLYYQTIVYNVCCTLDVAQGKKLVCGTSKTPTTEVQEAVSKISSENARLRAAGGGLCKQDKGSESFSVSGTKSSRLPGEKNESS